MVVKVDAMNILLWTGFFVAVAAIKQTRRNNQIQDIVNKLVKQYPGYQIINCNSIVIQDIEKAYESVFKIGRQITSTEELNNIYTKVFGSDKCFEKLQYTGATAEFAYNLLAAAWAGAISVDQFSINPASKALDEMREEFENLGYSTKDWVQNSKEHLQYLMEKYK